MSTASSRSSLKLSSLLSSSRQVGGSEYKIVGKKIGAGNFGEVRLGEHCRTGDKVAVKIERILNPKTSRWDSTRWILSRSEIEKWALNIVLILPMLLSCF